MQVRNVMNEKESLAKINALVRGEIQQLRPYEPEAALPEIRLDANESPGDVPPELKQAILEGLGRVFWNRYPDPEALRLRERLADRERVSPECILVGNGSDEIIRDLLTVYGGPGTRTVFPAPAFSMYRLLTLSTGGTPVGVRLREDWSLDEAGLVSELRHPNSRLAFIASPNNPTGNAFPRAAVEAVVRETERLIVLDEAYRMFSNGDLRALWEEYPQVVLLNTFSKSMSLAGIRLGYLVARPEIIQMLNRVRLPYNVDSMAQYIACQALEYGSIWEQQAQRVMAERERLAQRLQALPDMTVFPSQANFILIRHPRAVWLKTNLADRNIAVRGFEKTEALENCLRITVGTPGENDSLIAACRAVLNASAGEPSHGE
jgi:histidinol-phosphate aminotransferase